MKTVIKKLHHGLKIVSLLSAVALLNHCASTGEEDASDEELAADNVNNAAVNLNNGGNNLGEATNNAAVNEFANSNQPQNLGNQVPATGEDPFATPVNTTQTNNLLGGANAAAPTNAAANAAAPATNGTNAAAAAALTNATATPPTNTATVPLDATAAAPAAAPAAVPGMKDVVVDNSHTNRPDAKGRVKYVVTTATVHAQPNGPVVGEMATGDHPLIVRESNWAETQDGRYIRATNLSDQGVGRPRR